ncbi:BlaI/MecI/CopY family transcriptional regulator [Desulfosporosinus lacus]|uniref:BlaI family transcriptional regulator, penicillinase repressor n=1 Tax=Desulfosporosinus lacus DSM 15449 TaxID=1121420 RepID=A0A1M5SDY3_9FIRM|nr:BlaI/MecI/CopY family transcriptional regulator [Desulfosporosinus lacus]SHH36679.1 BlaI family transcriptional regulator, penicillinase repressor [Desulfosporosinus lacus DSM 15449]
MKNIPQITDAEWMIMKVLWNASPLGSGDVVNELKGTTDWKPKTIKTLLSRLVTKNAVAYDVGSRGYSYYPLVSENECAKEEARSFLGRVYNGSLKLFVKNFIENKELSAEEIAELKKLLEDK